MFSNTLLSRIYELSKGQPDKLAVAFKNDTLTYSQLIVKVCNIYDTLKSLGVEKGDRVCFSAVSKPETIAMYLAIQLVGGITVFLDKNATADSMNKIYQESGSKLLITDKPMNEFAGDCNLKSFKTIYGSISNGGTDVHDIISNFSVDEDQISELLFTSGTTGRPKGVILTYKAIYNILNNTIEGIGIRKDDILLLPLPLNHSFALRVLRAVLYSGGTLILQNGFTFAREVEKNILAFKCNSMACVPASYEVIKSQMQDAFVDVFANMRYIEFGAGSLSISQRKEITSLLPNVIIYNTWGSSETGGAIFCNVSEVVKNEELCCTLGKVLPGRTEICIQDSNGDVIQSSRDNPGRMVLKGDMQMAGYWNNNELTEETLKNGWLKTGDLAYIQSDYVFMLGRIDDIINVGGEKVSPIEVENIAGQYKFITECACVAGEDPKGVLGQIPVLFVVCKQGYIEDDFIRFMAVRMERYKLPQKIVKVDALPRNRMQKIERTVLKKKLVDNKTVELMNPVIETILSRHSIRSFIEKPIDEDILKTILKCGYHAPSGNNMQTWLFTVLTKSEDINKLKEKTKLAAEKNKVYFYGWNNPQTVILISNDQRNKTGCQDSACAAENIMLAASSFGLGSVWLNSLMTLRNEEPVEEVLDNFGIPKNHIVWACVALGYPAAEGQQLVKKDKVVRFI